MKTVPVIFLSVLLSTIASTSIIFSSCKYTKACVPHVEIKQSMAKDIAKPSLSPEKIKVRIGSAYTNGGNWSGYTLGAKVVYENESDTRFLGGEYTLVIEDKVGEYSSEFTVWVPTIEAHSRVGQEYDLKYNNQDPSMHWLLKPNGIYDYGRLKD